MFVKATSARAVRRLFVGPQPSARVRTDQISTVHGRWYSSGWVLTT